MNTNVWDYLFYLQHVPTFFMIHYRHVPFIVISIYVVT